MATTIKLKNSVTTTAAPTTLVQGEAAVNVTDKKVWVGNAASSPVQILGAGATIAGTSATISGLTSGRVTYAGTGGLLQDDADFTFNGTTVTMANDASISGLTVGKGGGAVATGTALGYQALNSNTTGGNNTAVGYQAGLSNTSGVRNAFFGDNAGYFATGNDNTAIGARALSWQSSGATGSSNTAVGGEALRYNTTASNNTAVGYQAGYSNTTGAYNTFIGSNAGDAVTTGINNLIVGFDAGGALTTGSGNTLVGRGSYVSAGSAMTTGSNNTILGAFTGNNSGLDIRTASNYIVLSDGDGNPRIVVDNNAQAIFGGVSFNANSSVTISSLASNGCTAVAATTSATNAWRFYNPNGQVGSISMSASATSFTTSSDYRLKENVVPMQNALAKVARLKPVTYTWKADGTNGEGFIAHELAEVCPDAVVGEKDAINEDGTIKAQGIDTSHLVATLTAAIQELKAEFDAYKASHP